MALSRLPLTALFCALTVASGVAMAGIATALINTNLTGQALAHCLNISGAAHVIVDAETSPVFEQAKAASEQLRARASLAHARERLRSQDLWRPR